MKAKAPTHSAQILTKRPRVGLLISNISRLGGGVSAFVIKLAQALRSTNIEPIVFSAQDRYLDEDWSEIVDIEIVSRPVRGPAAIGYLPGLLADMVRSDIDVLHLHGIWQYPSIAAQMWQRRTERPYIVSPHGMLEDWILDHGRAQKWLAKLVYEKSNLGRANLVHALTGAEADQIVRFAPGAKTIVMPSGIEIGEAFISDRPVADPYILYLGRLHPKKNLEAAIDAWAAMGEARGNSRFVIAGWGDEVYVADLVKRLEAVGPRTGIDYIGPVYGGGKERILAGARFLLLPSLSEGLPMTILEAWAEGVPVLMSSQCNLPEGFAAGAALDCGISAETIRATLVRALAIAQEERRTMSVAARDLVARKFSMTRVTESWTDIYRGLLAPSRIDGQHISESRSGRFNVPAG